MGDNDLLDTAALARYLGKNKRTVEDWRMDGRGPNYIRVGRSIRYRGADIQRWLDSLVVKVGS
jgi:predicted DNA-binding transcriptional regulator AlpA